MGFEPGRNYDRGAGTRSFSASRVLDSASGRPRGAQGPCRPEQMWIAALLGLLDEAA